MKRIYRLKIYISIIFCLVLLLCAFDYTMNIYGEQKQKVWPIYHWSLDFERIFTKINKGHIEVTFCDSVLEQPIPIQDFIRSQNKKWRYMVDDKYIFRFTDNVYYNIYKGAKTREAFESNVLSKLSCNKITYSLFMMRKNLRTKRTHKVFIKTFKYMKPVSSSNNK